MDPYSQTFTIQTASGRTIPLRMPQVDSLLRQVTATAINYAVQTGASIVMLVVLLTLTSRARYGRASTMLHIASLVISVVRCLLMTLYFTSSYVEFYTFFSGDYSHVDRQDTNRSLTASSLSIPQFFLVEATLMLQVWALVRMWPRGRRVALIAVSALVVVPAGVFRLVRVAIYMRATLDARASSYVWLLQCDLAFSIATIFWFCLVFICRLVLHMWSCRSVLPSMSRLSSMEVLVMTNGVLMLVPVVFAAMEFGSFTDFESGSLVLTSVVVVLPLGTLIAQHMTDEAGRRTLSRAAGASAGTGFSGYTRTANTATSGSNNRKRFFAPWSHASDETALVSGGIATQVDIHGGDNHKGKTVEVANHEMQQMDSPKTDRSQGVWVGREIEFRQDMV